MATASVLKVHYHFEFSGKKESADRVDFVGVTQGDYNSIRSVLNSNGKLLSGGTLVITSVQNMQSGPGTILV